MYYYLMYVLGRIRRLYFNQIPETDAEYTKSRRAFVVDGVTALTILQLVGGSFLAGYLKHAGFSDAANGIIAAIPALMAFVQPIGALHLGGMRKKKLLICAGALIHRFLFALAFMATFLIPDKKVAMLAILACFALAHGVGSYISPAATGWLASLIPPHMRGRYYGSRERSSMVVMSIASYIAGIMLDKCREAGIFSDGYAALGFIILGLCFANFLAISKSMEPESYVAQQPTTLVNVWKTFLLPFTVKSFRPVLILLMLWNICCQLFGPYWGLHLVSNLSLSYTYISAFALLSGAVRAIAAGLMGKFADKTSWKHVLRISFLCLAVSRIIEIFIIKESVYILYPIITIIAAVGWGGIGISTLNIQLTYAPEELQARIIGATAAISGLIGFFGVFLGAVIVDFVGRHGFTFIAGAPLYPQQVLGMISALILMVCINLPLFKEGNPDISADSEGS